MLETAQVSSTVPKCSPVIKQEAPSADLLPWTSENDGESFPVKLEVSESFDNIVLNQPLQSSSDFAELKPLPYDYEMDPVLATNNNSKDMTDLNRSSPQVGSSSVRPTSSSSSSSADVTSSGMTKLETLDFTASQDAFDDLASIVGISMGADSTVPTMDSDMDLDAWIENTAQNIKPLDHQQQTWTSSSSTLQSLLQGTLTPTPPSGKVTQLQQRDPPPYSILQTRLQQATPVAALLANSNVVKVDSTFDLMKIANAAAVAAASNNTESNSSYLSAAAASASYADSLPHSTVDSRRMDFGGLTKMKAKQNKMRQKLGLGHHPVGVLQGGDQSKKMMHHCQICNRGFLNKSNIKVHLRTHTGEKPFKCEHCSKAFRQKAHLLKHMSIHKRISRD